MDQYSHEAKLKWGKTAAYAEYAAKTKDYSAEKLAAVNAGMDAIMGEFAACKKAGHAPASPEAQALVAKLQSYVTANLYACTDEILAGLGNMYVADERFTDNIDKHGDGTARFISKAIRSR